MPIRRHLVLAFTVAAPFCAATSGIAAPALDCRKAATDVDREICGSDELKAMDREIAALYDRGLASFTGEDRHRLAQSQVAFVHRREGCSWAAHHSAHPGVAVEECVRNSMDGRLRTLRSIVDRGRF